MSSQPRIFSFPIFQSETPSVKQVASNVHFAFGGPVAFTGKSRSESTPNKVLETESTPSVVTTTLGTNIEEVKEAVTESILSKSVPVVGSNVEDLIREALRVGDPLNKEVKAPGRNGLFRNGLPPPLKMPHLFVSEFGPSPVDAWLQTLGKENLGDLDRLQLISSGRLLTACVPTKKVHQPRAPYDESDEDNFYVTSTLT
jgi:hypothetical protein